MRWHPAPTDRPTGGLPDGWRSRSLSLALPLFALGGWLWLAWLSHHPPAGLIWWLLGVLAVEWALALWVGSHAPLASSRSWIAWGIAFRLLGLFAAPILEDDHFRFLWDGRIFALAGNPYASSPSAHFADPTVPPAFAEILDRVNNPDVPTIYGPLFELGFLLSYLAAPAAVWPWKLLLLGADIALLVMLRRLGPTENGARAAVFAAWCPLSIMETAYNAHPDALAVTLMTGAALVSAGCGRPGWLGFWCGAAAGAKVFALFLAPFLLWGRRWTAWAGFFAVLLACYLPFWWQGSGADLAGLSAFAGQWEFNSSGYALLAWALGPRGGRLLAALLFAAGWTVLFARWARRPDRHQTLPPGLLVFALFFLWSPTFNPWYGLWLLPFVAWRPAPAGIAALAAVSLSYLTKQNLGEGGLDGFGHPGWVRPVEFALIGSGLVLELWRRRQLGAVTAARQFA